MKKQAARALVSQTAPGPQQGIAPQTVSPAMTEDQRIRASRESRSLSLSIPTKEAELAAFVLNFARTIASDPQRFITDPKRARELLELAEDYANLFALAKDPNTRSTAVNARKDAARTIAVKAVRTHAKWIKAQPTISVEGKVRVGCVAQRPIDERGRDA